ncbi:uncharacterized protein LOC134727927 [Mytilus trossulus]|uniref:uncharacterized protein LOC134727927 n=1 Tax=Mytilus trossulus TaxID=6551 RepID=UPI003006033D
MEEGTKCEIDAVATLVGKFLPFYYPNLKFVEEGAHVLHTDNKSLVLVSPDGSLSQIEINSTKSEVTKLACEFKCPCPTDYKTPVHYEIPQRYIPQILGEMAALITPDLLYLSWTEESTIVIKAKFDEDLWNIKESEIKKLVWHSNTEKTYPHF